MDEYTEPTLICIEKPDSDGTTRRIESWSNEECGESYAI